MIFYYNTFSNLGYVEENFNCSLLYSTSIAFCAAVVGILQVLFYIFLVNVENWVGVSLVILWAEIQKLNFYVNTLNLLVNVPESDVKGSW